MSLTISNSGPQEFRFNFREPANNLLARVVVRRGGQEQIGEQWTPAQKKKVIEQLERFGARDAAESHGKLGKFLGILYRDNGLIDPNEIRLGHAAVVDTQEQRSVAEAKKGVLGFDRAVNQGKRTQRAAPTTEVEVEQLSAPHDRKTGSEVRFRMAVDPNGRDDVALPA